MIIRNVINVEYFPGDPPVWKVTLECWHTIWKNFRHKPTIKQMRCHRCEK